MPLTGFLLCSIRRLERARGAASEESRRAKGAERKFQELLQVAPAALVMTDVQGRIALSNRKAEHLFDYMASELRGAPIEMLVPEQLRERHRAHVVRFMEWPLARPMGTGFDLAGCRCD